MDPTLNQLSHQNQTLLPTPILKLTPLMKASPPTFDSSPNHDIMPLTQRPIPADTRGQCRNLNPLARPRSTIENRSTSGWGWSNPKKVKALSRTHDKEKHHNWRENSELGWILWDSWIRALVVEVLAIFEFGTWVLELDFGDWPSVGFWMVWELIGILALWLRAWWIEFGFGGDFRFKGFRLKGSRLWMSN